MNDVERRVFRRLADGAILKSSGGAWRLGRKTVSRAVVEALRERDWAALRNGQLRITVPGLAALKRAQSRPMPPHEDPISPFRQQHGEIASAALSIPGRKPQRVRRNHTESPLAWLHRRRGVDGAPLITARQLQAGETLRRDFEQAGLSPNTTSRWDGLPIGQANQRDGLDPTTAQIAARQRMHRALAALGDGLDQVALRVCCFHQGLALAETQLGWPKRSAKLVLGLALDRLADHYHIKITK